jgi:hypothetical protein
MARELFRTAAREHKEPQGESRRRKILISCCWIFAIVAFGYGGYLTTNFPLSISFLQLASMREYQIVLTEAVIVFLLGLSALPVFSLVVWRIFLSFPSPGWCDGVFRFVRFWNRYRKKCRSCLWTLLCITAADDCRND